jgi:hypothetical protein
MDSPVDEESNGYKLCLDPVKIKLEFIAYQCPVYHLQGCSTAIAMCGWQGLEVQLQLLLPFGSSSVDLDHVNLKAVSVPK